MIEIFEFPNFHRLDYFGYLRYLKTPFGHRQEVNEYLHRKVGSLVVIYDADLLETTSITSVYRRKG